MRILKNNSINFSIFLNNKKQTFMRSKIQHACLLTLIALTAFSFNSNAQNYWKLLGNSGTDPAINFLGTSNSDPLVIRTNNIERMRILPSGKVGIGISNPKAILNVFSGDYVSLSTPGILMLGKETGYNLAMDINVIQARVNGAAASLYLNYYGGNTYVGPGAALQISTGNMEMYGKAGINGLSNAGYALNVNAGSLLGGVNITDPVDNTGFALTKSGLNYGLFVSKTSTSSAVATIYSTNAGSGQGIYASSVNNSGVYGYNSGGNSGVYGNSGGGTGSVGVTGSCTGVGYGMAAYGDAGSGIYATSVSNYAGYFVGNVFSTGSYVGSDLRLKQNIQDVTKAMDIIGQLKPKLYNFKNDGNYKLMNLPKGQHYGLIAQDLEKVLPNLVRDTKFETGMAKPPAVPTGKEGTQPKKETSETIDFKAVNYTELIPIMIKGMQEQQAIIENQQQQIDELKQMVQNNGGTSNFSSPKTATESNNAYLLQNAPNPFTQNTTVRCFVPTGVQQAKLVVYNMNGQLLKSYDLSQGMNSVTISAGTLSSGQYIYSLLADGKKIDSKNMSLTK